MRFGCYTLEYGNGFQFNSHLVDFPFVFFLYFFSALMLHLRVSLRLGQGFPTGGTRTP